MSIQVLEIIGGARADVLELEGERIVLRCRRAYPPGTPLEAISPAGATVQIKVRSCRKDLSPELGAAEPGAPEPEMSRFRVEGRLFNVSRALRKQLLGS